MRPPGAGRSSVHSAYGGRLFALNDLMHPVDSILINLKPVMQVHPTHNVASFRGQGKMTLSYFKLLTSVMFARFYSIDEKLFKIDRLISRGRRNPKLLSR